MSVYLYILVANNIHHGSRCKDLELGEGEPPTNTD